MKRLTSLLIAFILTANAWALPPEIEADRLLLKAKAALDASDYALATESLMKAEKLPVKLPDTFYYHYGRASFGSGKFEQSRELLEKYLTLSGTKGKFYQEALDKMNNIEVEIQKRDAEIKKREAEKDAALAQLKQIGFDDPKVAAQGYWRDPKTNLVWMRCSLGQTWDGNTCTGVAIKYTLEQAKDVASGYTNWVVPDIEELSTIFYCSTGFEKAETISTKAGDTKTVSSKCAGSNYVSPTINKTIFPNTENGRYWSSSIYTPLWDYNWYSYVDFSDGTININQSYQSFYVRLVRSGQ